MEIKIRTAGTPSLKTPLFEITFGDKKWRFSCAKAIMSISELLDHMNIIMASQPGPSELVMNYDQVVRKIRINSPDGTYTFPSLGS